MSGQYKKISRIEHIQNERWHKQYIVHRDDFKKSLKMNTEKFLYHGCTDVAATSIIRDYFNRSFAGKHGRCCFLSFCHLCLFFSFGRRCAEKMKLICFIFNPFLLFS